MKSSLRIKADKAKKLRCKNLIAVLESPKTIENIGSTIRNVDALGVEKLYVIDTYKILPKNWMEMRDRQSLNKISVGAVKWSYVRPFKSTEDCINYLNIKKFVSVVTSPHVKGKTNVILHEGKYTQKRLAVWFGNESHGVSDAAVNHSKTCVNIPMCGIVESLNLGTSTGIVLYEITKQRRQFQQVKQHISHLRKINGLTK